MKFKPVCLLIVLLILSSCKSSNKKLVPVIGFLDYVQDETLEQAKKGFFVALKDSGFDPMMKTLEVVYRNAQSDQPTLLQACDYLISQKVDLFATNPTLSTITAIQKTQKIPVFMMVSPRPDIAGLVDRDGHAPMNLFGVYETLDYIDTAVMLVKSILPQIKRMGTIFNQAEPQSVDALNRIEKICTELGIELIKQPVNNSNETQLVVAALLTKNIEAFFALPDNTVFSSMEIIVKSCDDAHVPVFTSEEGLVKRGAVAAFGADMYQWGYQSGQQAATALKKRSYLGLQPELVKVRRRVFNASKAKSFTLTFDSTFTAVK